MNDKEAGPLGAASQRAPHAFQRDLELLGDQPRVKPEYTESERAKRRLSARISAAPARMMRAIDLNDEPTASANEITDVSCERDLPTKRNPELAIGESCTEQVLGRRRVSAFSAAHRRQCSESRR